MRRGPTKGPSNPASMTRRETTQKGGSGNAEGKQGSGNAAKASRPRLRSVHSRRRRKENRTPAPVSVARRPCWGKKGMPARKARTGPIAGIAMQDRMTQKADRPVETAPGRRQPHRSKPKTLSRAWPPVLSALQKPHKPVLGSEALLTLLRRCNCGRGRRRRAEGAIGGKVLRQA